MAFDCINLLSRRNMYLQNSMEITTSIIFLNKTVQNPKNLNIF